MKAGKVERSTLKNTILEQITHHRNDVLVGAGIGEDSAVVDFGENSLVISSDPITGAADNAGFLAVNVACNDLISNGAIAVGIEVVLLLPEKFTEENTISLMKEIDQSAKKLNVEILGGHTEVLDLVRAPIIVVTAIGKVKKGEHLSSANAKAGDDIVLSKGAGIEGTYILANDHANTLKKNNVDQSIIEVAKTYKSKLSVIKEGKIAKEYGVNAMHDVTEGGVYGAMREMAEAANLGFELNKVNVIINKETKVITEALEIDPLALISSGSLLISTQNGKNLVEKLKNEGIKASLIGKFKVSNDYFLKENGKVKSLDEKNKDELWNFLEKT
ncbi:MAG: AIR synthase family protein [Halanaerobiales bacterium]